MNNYVKHLEAQHLEIIKLYRKAATPEERNRLAEAAKQVQRAMEEEQAWDRIWANVKK